MRQGAWLSAGGPIAIWAIPKCMSKHAKWVFPLQWNDVEVHYCITATVQNQSECRWRSWCEEKSKHAPSWHRGCRSFARPASAPIPQIEKWKKENTPEQNSMMRVIFFGKTYSLFKDLMRPRSKNAHEYAASNMGEEKAQFRTWSVHGHRWQVWPNLQADRCVMVVVLVSTWYYRPAV